MRHNVFSFSNHFPKFNCFFSNEKWNARFDLRQVLKDLHADPSHIKAWEIGMVLSLNAELKKEQPLLYPYLRDMG